MNRETSSRPEIKEGGPRFKLLFVDLDTGKTDQASSVMPKIGWEARNLGALNHLVREKIQVEPTERTYRQTTEQNPQGTKKKVEWRTLPLRENPSVFAGIIISGSGLTVRREGPEELLIWRQHLNDYLRQAVRDQVPILGICAGAQVIARAFGGEVARMRKVLADGRKVIDKEVGCHLVQRASGSREDPLLMGLPAEFLTQENHDDIITQLPEEAQLLAVNDRGIQAFRVGTAWGVQFHPERTAKVTRRYLEKNRGKLEDRGHDVDGLLAAVEETPEASRILTNFLNLALQKA